MGKSPKVSDQLSTFQRFEKFTKALISVPKKELDAKLDKYKRDKVKRKTG